MKRILALLLAILLTCAGPGVALAEDVPVEVVQATDSASAEEAPGEAGGELLLDAEAAGFEPLDSGEIPLADSAADAAGDAEDSGSAEADSLPDPTSNASGLTLTLVSDTSGKYGHAFLIVRNDTGRAARIGNYILPSEEQATLGLRSKDLFGLDGAYINVESYRASAYTKFSYATCEIDQDKLDKVADHFKKNSSYGSGLWHNCAMVASGAWNKVCPFLYIVVPDNIPGDLKLQIDMMPGSKKGTSLTRAGLLDRMDDLTKVFYLDKKGRLVPMSIRERISAATASVETTARDATLKWKAAVGVPHEYTAGKTVYGKGYAVQIKKAESEKYTTKFVSGLEKESFTLTALTPGKEYDVRVFPAYRYSVEGKYVYFYGDGFTGSFTTNKVTLNKTSLSLGVGKSYTLRATKVGTTTTHPLFWGTTNPKVATVDASGNVKALSAGTATISVSYGGHTAKCTVTVGSTELSGYLGKRLSDTAKKLGGLKKRTRTVDGTRYCEYISNAIELRATGSFDAKINGIIIKAKSPCTLHKLTVGMTEEKMLKIAKNYAGPGKTYDADGRKVFWYYFKAKSSDRANNSLRVEVRNGKIFDLYYSP